MKNVKQLLHDQVQLKTSSAIGRLYAVVCCKIDEETNYPNEVPVAHNSQQSAYFEPSPSPADIYFS